MELLGDPGFIYWWRDDDWFIMNKKYPDEITCFDPATGLQFVDGMVKLFHGTTLHQVHGILRDGFKSGLYHRGSQNHPCGVWGCTRPEVALVKAKPERGWSREANEDKVSSWDCPVVLAIFVPKDELYVNTRYKCGTLKVCQRFMPGTTVPIAPRVCEIYIYQSDIIPKDQVSKHGPIQVE